MFADVTFYKDTYLGHPAADDTELARYLQRASDDIDAICINGIDVTALSADAVVWLKKATCARAEQYIMSGTEDPDESASGSLGGFSISSSDNNESSGGIPINTRCKMFLIRTGLMNRSIGRISDEAYSC